MLKARQDAGSQVGTLSIPKYMLVPAELWCPVYLYISHCCYLIGPY